MIVCSCNVLTKQQILDAAATEAAHAPRSPAQTYRCLGCAPDCGRCLVTVRAILAEARLAGCNFGCPTCPGHHQDDEGTAPVYAMAAE
jgi:bacterioferritin-associated ferredoxin